MSAALRPFRFGVYFRSGFTQPGGSSAPPAFDRAFWHDFACRVEDLGYDILSLPDHFGHQPAPIAAAMSVLDATTRLRVTTGVLDNDFRHPLVVAREFATMSVLSGGRVELGIGAGWLRADYDASGVRFDSSGVRVGRLEEAVQVLRGAWGPGRCAFRGEHYQVDDDTFPKPVPPGIRLMIGGGSPRVLRLAGRQADVVGINVRLAVGAQLGAGRALTPDLLAAEAGPASYERKIGWVREGAGERFPDLELQMSPYLTSVTRDADGVVAGLAQRMGVAPELVSAMPSLLVGDVPAITAKLVAVREKYGISYVTFDSDAYEAVAPVVARLAGT